MEEDMCYTHSMFSGGFCLYMFVLQNTIITNPIRIHWYTKEQVLVCSETSNNSNCRKIIFGLFLLLVKMGTETTPNKCLQALTRSNTNNNNNKPLKHQTEIVVIKQGKFDVFGLNSIAYAFMTIITVGNKEKKTTAENKTRLRLFSSVVSC